MICAGCKKPIIKGQSRFRHPRLGVYIHVGCPTTDIVGEDITTHTVEYIHSEPNTKL